jgi:NADH:ubiquinone oxidoreductase subunit 6 (subunit J)
MDNTAIKARATRRLKTCAIVCLSLLGLFIISQLLSIHQTRKASPLLPNAVIQQINQQYLLHAVVSSIMLLIAVGLYLLKRYWSAILLVAITLVGNQYLNW